MGRAALRQGKVICFRCRATAGEGRCRCGSRAPKEQRRLTVAPSMLGLWLAGAALAGSFLGAALALLHG